MSGYNVDNPNENYTIPEPECEEGDDIIKHDVVDSKGTHYGSIRDAITKVFNGDGRGVKRDRRSTDRTDAERINEGIPDDYRDREVDEVELVETDPVLLEVLSEVKKLNKRVDKLMDSYYGNMLCGATAIYRYLGFSGKVQAANIIKPYFEKYGLPAFMNSGGRWCTTKSLIDKWIYEQSVKMRKAEELGMKLERRTWKRTKYIPVCDYTEEQNAILRREIIKDRVKEASLIDG